MIVKLRSKRKTLINYPVNCHYLDVNQVDFWQELTSECSPNQLRVHLISGLNVDFDQDDWELSDWNSLVDALTNRWCESLEREKQE